MYHNFSIHSSVKGHLGCFYVLAIVNSAAMNNGIHVSFSVLVSSGYIPRSGFAGLYGGFIPSFLRNLYTIFHWRRQWHPTPVLLPGKSHGQRSLVGCSPLGREESDTTEWFHFHFMHWRRKWQPTPVFLPGESQGRGSLVGCHLWGCTESDTTEVT